MTTFDEREQAFENKFKHDQELLFRIYARRAKLAGLWAADLMGMAGEDADAYAKQIVSVDFEEAGHQDIVRRLRKDFDAKGVECSDHKIEKKLADLLEDARAQVMAS